LSPDPDSPCLVTCRENFEPLVAAELEALGLEVVDRSRRAVFFHAGQAGIYKANMALRTGLNVLVPIRSFNARNYEMLYYQARKTNWHKLFPVDKTIRIDVNGGSDKLSHTQYVVHRVKDGIVDTFRKLTDGIRPSIRKEEPDIHIVVHLDGLRVTLLLDTSGSPLFKRGYRTRHGGAPLKEDLAAAILKFSGWDCASRLIDPCCGSGTFLFEAWQMATQTPPNLNRRFGFESLFDYDPELHRKERENLEAAIRPLPDTVTFHGADLDPDVIALAEEIRNTHFQEAPITFETTDCEETLAEAEAGFLISNPPYGQRSGDDAAALEVHETLGRGIENRFPQAAVYTANPTAAKALPKAPKPPHKLYNGKLEGRLYVYG